MLFKAWVSKKKEKDTRIRLGMVFINRLYQLIAVTPTHQMGKMFCLTWVEPFAVRFWALGIEFAHISVLWQVTQPAGLASLSRGTVTVLYTSGKLSSTWQQTRRPPPISHLAVLFIYGGSLRYWWGFLKWLYGTYTTIQYVDAQSHIPKQNMCVETSTVNRTPIYMARAPFWKILPPGCKIAKM